MFRYREDILPTTIFVFYFFLDLLVYLLVQNKAVVLAWFFLGIFPKACICAWNHHHQHVPTFKHWLPNRILEFVYAFHSGIVSDGWTLHHVLGHHQNYLDQTLDESRWARKDGSKMGVIEYSFLTALTGYPRAFIVGFKFKKYLLPFTVASLVVLTTLILMTIYNPFNAFFVFILPMMISFYITAWHTYYHHAGLESDDHMLASYNILHRGYNILTGNLGYHTAHHYKMGVHWSKLPELHEKIKDKIPEDLYRDPSIPFCWFPK